MSRVPSISPESGDFASSSPFYRTEADIVTIGEGRTTLQTADLLARQMGMNRGNLLLQYEGLNPSGSFKDNGMTAAFTHARMVGAKRVACASTGNTSASLAMFASLAQVQGIVFIGSGKISIGKLSQALDYGALTLQIQGDFDACLRRIRQIAQNPAMGIYLMNSVNPFRLEGQKSIMLRILEARDWQPPDWIIVPGGNLGNCSAFGKAYIEMKELGLVKKVPRTGRHQRPRRQHAAHPGERTRPDLERRPIRQLENLRPLCGPG